jgi:hypothetical protein
MPVETVPNIGSEGNWRKAFLVEAVERRSEQIDAESAEKGGGRGVVSVAWRLRCQPQ